jgi:hypothetical protein
MPTKDLNFGPSSINALEALFMPAIVAAIYPPSDVMGDGIISSYLDRQCPASLGQTRNCLPSGQSDRLEEA